MPLLFLLTMCGDFTPKFGITHKYLRVPLRWLLRSVTGQMLRVNGTMTHAANIVNANSYQT